MKSSGVVSVCDKLIQKVEELVEEGFYIHAHDYAEKLYVTSNRYFLSINLEKKLYYKSLYLCAKINYYMKKYRDAKKLANELIAMIESDQDSSMNEDFFEYYLLVIDICLVDKFKKGNELAEFYIKFLYRYLRNTMYQRIDLVLKLRIRTAMLSASRSNFKKSCSRYRYVLKKSSAIDDDKVKYLACMSFVREMSGWNLNSCYKTLMLASVYQNKFLNDFHYDKLIVNELLMKYYFENNEYGLSLMHAKIIKKLILRHHGGLGIPYKNILYKEARIHYVSGELNKSRECANLALLIVCDMENCSTLDVRDWEILDLLSDIYDSENAHEKSLKYRKKAIESIANEKNKYRSNESYLFLKIACTYKKLKMHKVAKINYDQSMEILNRYLLTRHDMDCLFSTEDFSGFSKIVIFLESKLTKPHCLVSEKIEILENEILNLAKICIQ